MNCLKIPSKILGFLFLALIFSAPACAGSAPIATSQYMLSDLFSEYFKAKDIDSIMALTHQEGADAETIAEFKHRIEKEFDKKWLGGTMGKYAIDIKPYTKNGVTYAPNLPVDDFVGVVFEDDSQFVSPYGHKDGRYYLILPKKAGN